MSPCNFLAPLPEWNKMRSLCVSHFNSYCRSALRRPLERQGRLHWGHQLQRPICVRVSGHLPLQSWLHFVGKCLEALCSRWRLDWHSAAMQNHQLRATAPGGQRSIPIGQWILYFLAQFGGILLPTGTSDGPSQPWWVKTAFFLTT